MASLTLPKPRLIQVYGVWFCDGLSGSTPALAYDRWLMKHEPWRFIPMGMVPRVHGRPA